MPAASARTVRESTHCKRLPSGGNELPSNAFSDYRQRRKYLYAAVNFELARALHCLLQRTHRVNTQLTEIDGMELNVLSQHEQALKFRAHRNQVLSANIANADTPGYKARDLDFTALLEQAKGGSLKMTGNDERHLGIGSGEGRSLSTVDQLKYRIPMQPTLDGNTVETDVEQAAFAENALMYRASLAFLDGQIRSIRYALKGGD